LIIRGPDAANGAMSTLRTRRSRAFVGALAILGAVLNAWLLTVHTTSMALTAFDASGSEIVICRQGSITTIVAPGTGRTRPASKTHCPICSGLAALHFGVIAKPGVEIARNSLPDALASVATVASTTDRRPYRILNRGPPSLV
jgi:hypothetical protein